MLQIELLQMLYVSTVAMLAAAVIVATTMKLCIGRRTSARQQMRDLEGSIAFLFDDTDLADATPSARALLRHRDKDQTDWDLFVAVFGPRFPLLRQGLKALGAEGLRRIESGDDSEVYLEITHWDGLSRITYQDDAASPKSGSVAKVTMDAINDELETLRTLADEAPQLIWKEDPNRVITWANRAYLDLVAMLEKAPSHAIPIWPPVNLFLDLERSAGQMRPLVRRTPLLHDQLEEPLWFEVTTVQRDNSFIYFGIDANAAVRAEKTQRNFVQTLGKTFAQLATGLAIFDRKRQLLIFNPALATLTGLSVEFLSARPHFNMVLDKLREARMLPEPKNYMSWREEFAALESAAKDGTYCDIWDLPNGQTYRVTGRPHPDGAMAFLFEDISDEILLTRRFRSEIETSRAVLDVIEEAVAVFSMAGNLSLSNAAYDRLWNTRQNVRLSDAAIIDQLRIWQSRCTPSPIWGRVRDFVGTQIDRVEWSETVHLDDGRRITCRFVPLPGGATLAGFRVASKFSKLQLPTKVIKGLRHATA